MTNAGKQGICPCQLQLLKTNLETEVDVCFS